MSGVFRSEPAVSLSDYSAAPASWSDLDDELTNLIGASCVALPSVRVAMFWTLQHMNLRRHRDEVFLPRFMGRCILNSLNRAALPSETPGPRTKAVVAVHQFGFRPGLERIQEECETRNVPYFEDSPSAIATVEGPARGSMVKFVGLSKVLPALKGAFAITDDASLRSTLLSRRAERSPWSWLVLPMLAMLRAGARAPLQSTLADVAYELYPVSAGDNVAFRANFRSAVRQIHFFCSEFQARVAILRALLDEALIPSGIRLGAAALLPLDRFGETPGQLLAQHGFDDTAYHFDSVGNPFDPSYIRVFTLPLNPRIPRSSFEAVVESISRHRTRNIQEKSQ